jgi:hypothetical protein
MGMGTIVEFLGTDHRACDGLFVTAVGLPELRDISDEENLPPQPDA